MSKLIIYANFSFQSSRTSSNGGRWHTVGGHNIGQADLVADDTVGIAERLDGTAVVGRASFGRRAVLHADWWVFWDLNMDFVDFSPHTSGTQEIAHVSAVL